MTFNSARRGAVLAAVARLGDCAYVTGDLPTIRYVTGFSGSNATVVIDGDRVVVITDGRYQEQVSAECSDVDVIIERDIPSALTQLLTGRPVALDDRASVAFANRLKEAGLGVTAGPDPIRALRVTKDEDEIQALRAACAITARGLGDIAESIKPGQREVDIARRLEQRFVELGAEDRAFPTIVGSGANSAIPHHRAGDKTLEVGDLLVIDCGAMVAGYHADMTRTYVVGANPASWQRELHDVVRQAQQAGMDAVQPKTLASSIDSAARQVIADAGYARHFTHGTGHGVGLQIHEEPMISATNDVPVPAGAAITVEPGVYLPSRGGVRIEDTVLVGYEVQVLTQEERTLTRVG
ncbi:MAG TPA: aminopeptidase P family protein [Candidatus Nanopelagicales bacterium]|nr:aminopeptidase P family protein [Candidatus Nanopelagicales bacterium]